MSSPYQHLHYKEVYYIDTDRREQGHSGDFTYKIKIPQQCDSVSVLQASIPKSYYLVQSNNNTFSLIEDQNEYLITIPEGNYSMRVFLNVLTNLLNTVGSYTYTISYPDSTQPDTGKFTYSVSNNTTQPIFQFDAHTTIVRQMGFENGGTYHFSSNKLISSNILNFQKSNIVYILSDICISHGAQQQTQSVLQELFCGDTFDYSRIQYLNNDVILNSKKISNVHQDSFTFTLVDEDLNVLNLNGQEVAISLVCFKR